MPGHPFTRSQSRALLLPSRRTAAARHELPAAFAAPYPTDEELELLLQQYRRTESDADFEALVLRLLPVLAGMAVKKRLGGKSADELDELISDGSLRLAQEIRRIAARPHVKFIALARRSIAQGFINGRRERAWCGRRKNGSHGHHLMHSLRRAFLRAHGRMPTGAELRAALDVAITNPGVEKELLKRDMLPLSSCTQEEAATLANLMAGNQPTPLAAVIDRETMRLALRGFSDLDAAVFKLAIDGMSAAEVARRYGMSYTSAYKWINGLLWRARTNAQLSAALGVEAENKPDGKFQHFHAISRLGPAKPVAV